MSDPTPSSIAASPLGDRQTALSLEAIDAILADFRQWLVQAAAAAPESPPSSDRPPLDLHTLLGQMIALKHEVNLQTKATRAQQEQASEALRQLGEAVEELRLARAATASGEAEDEDARVRPLLKTLVDLADAVGLARREVRRVQEGLASYLEQLVGEAEPAPRSSLLARWFGRLRPAGEPWRERSRQVTEQVRQFLESVITGYTMSLQRVERALAQHGLEAIESVGQPFDPERMEVVEVVAANGRPAGQVLEEVRRGYLWHGRVFRFAQVRVTKP